MYSTKESKFVDMHVHHVHGQAVYKISREHNLHKNGEQQTKQRLQKIYEQKVLWERTELESY